MDAFAQLALMAKAKLVFESDTTFLSFPVSSPVSFPPERLRFADPSAASPQDLLDRSEFARMTNRIARGVIAPIDDEEHLWDVYADVLEQGQAAVAAAVSPEDQARYEAAMTLLYVQSTTGIRQDSEALTTYKRYRDAHIKAQEEYRNRQFTGESSQDPATKAQWEQDEPQLREALDRALQEWLTVGRKAEIEAAQQFREAYESRAPAVMWGQWQTSFMEDIDTQTDTNTIQYALTGFAPHDLFDHGPWPSFTLTQEEMVRLAAEAPPELRRYFDSNTMDSGIESVSFEYRSVALTRGWFRPEVFQSRCWRLGAEGGELCDGGQPPHGRCPSYVTALVFARNVTITSRQPPDNTSRPTADQPSQVLWSDATIPPEMLRQEEVAPEAPQAAESPPRKVVVRDHRARLPEEAAVSDFRASSAVSEAAPASELPPAFLRQRRAASNPTVQSRPRAAMKQTFTELPPPVPPPAPPEHTPDTTVSTVPDVTILAFICKRLPRCPDPDPTLSW